jgi:hypothetical protein
MSLIKKVHFDIGFGQLSLRLIAKESGLVEASEETAARGAADRMRLPIAEGCSKRIQSCQTCPWVLRWLTQRTKEAGGIIWLRLNAARHRPNG